MRDLLYDNIAVKHHFENPHRAMGMQLTPVSANPRVREVTSLPACFLTFLAVGTSDQSKLTYTTLLIREAMKHRGQGWLEYDRLFWQQAALNPGGIHRIITMCYDYYSYYIMNICDLICEKGPLGVGLGVLGNIVPQYIFAILLNTY